MKKSLAVDYCTFLHIVTSRLWLGLNLSGLYSVKRHGLWGKIPNCSPSKHFTTTRTSVNSLADQVLSCVQGFCAKKIKFIVNEHLPAIPNVAPEGCLGCAASRSTGAAESRKDAFVACHQALQSNQTNCLNNIHKNFFWFPFVGLHMPRHASVVACWMTGQSCSK